MVDQPRIKSSLARRPALGLVTDSSCTKWANISVQWSLSGAMRAVTLNYLSTSSGTDQSRFCMVGFDLPTMPAPQSRRLGSTSSQGSIWGATPLNTMQFALFSSLSGAWRDGAAQAYAER